MPTTSAARLKVGLSVVQLGLLLNSGVVLAQSDGRGSKPATGALTGGPVSSIPLRIMRDRYWSPVPRAGALLQDALVIPSPAWEYLLTGVPTTRDPCHPERWVNYTRAELIAAKAVYVRAPPDYLMCWPYGRSARRAVGDMHRSLADLGDFATRSPTHASALFARCHSSMCCDSHVTAACRI